MNQRDSLGYSWWGHPDKGSEDMEQLRTHRKGIHGSTVRLNWIMGKWIRQRLLGKITDFPLAFMEEFGRAGRHQGIKHSAGWKDTGAGSSASRLRWGLLGSVEAQDAPFRAWCIPAVSSASPSCQGASSADLGLLI